MFYIECPGVAPGNEISLQAVWDWLQEGEHSDIFQLTSYIFQCIWIYVNMIHVNLCMYNIICFNQFLYIPIYFNTFWCTTYPWWQWGLRATFMIEQWRLSIEYKGFRGNSFLEIPFVEHQQQQHHLLNVISSSPFNLNDIRSKNWWSICWSKTQTTVELLTLRSSKWQYKDCMHHFILIVHS